MIFGEMRVEDSVGAIAAHSIRAGDVALRKGSVVSAEIVAALLASGVKTLTAARLEPGDIGEDEAARILAEASAGPGIRVDQPFTGRCNLFAVEAGLLLVEDGRVNAVNAVDEAVTLATLAPHKPVVVGEMVATVKIIPYGVSRLVLEGALAAGGEGTLVSVAPYRLRRIGVISTTNPGLKPSVIAKTVGALDARLRPADAKVVDEAACPHELDALRRELVWMGGGDLDLVVVFGASAIADRRDVVPAAIEAAGGWIEHFGMPVDPGNLLLVGSLAGKPVIGAPGCARSPKENGFDWVLQRLLARLPVTRAVIASLGVGGLLMEIVSRGQPRAGGAREEDD